MYSTSGLSMRPRNWRAYADRDSTVAALAFGVDGVEGEGALAGAGDAGYDDELVAGDGYVYVLEVVFAGAANDDVLKGHGGRVSSSWLGIDCNGFGLMA